MIVLYFTGDGEPHEDSEQAVGHFILKSTVFNIKKSEIKLAISFIYA